MVATEKIFEDDNKKENEKGVKGVLFSLCFVSQNSKALAGLTNPPYVTVGILVLTMPQE